MPATGKAPDPPAKDVDLDGDLSWRWRCAAGWGLILYLLGALVVVWWLAT